MNARLGSDSPALAQDAAQAGASFADFLEQVLANEQLGRHPWAGLNACAFWLKNRNHFSSGHTFE